MTDDPRQPSAEAEAFIGPTASGEASGAHVVPATPVGEGVRCPRCGVENRAGLSFCSACGGRLVAAADATLERPGQVTAFGACPRCGSANRADAVFCANCGQALQAFAPAPPVTPARARARHAILGPLVLLIATAGLVLAWLLPFGTLDQSMAERMFGSGGTGIAFWSAYPPDAGVLESAFYGVAAPLPVLALLLVSLAVAGFVRSHAGRWQRTGAWLGMAWCVAFIVLFLLAEVAGGFGDGLIGLLRGMSPAGLIGFLASLIGIVGTVTRLADS